MPATDPAILAQLQTLWGEPVTQATTEADSQSAFVPSEWQPSPIPSAGLSAAERAVVDRVLSVFAPPITSARPIPSPVTWNAATAELIDWFQANQDRLPVEPFALKPGGGVRVADPVLWYRSLGRDIATGPTGPRVRLGTLEDDLSCLRRVVQKQSESG
ncbi:MAG: hypothetical protein ACKV2Q_17205 [Planctomycetaceae bacterium]